MRLGQLARKLSLRPTQIVELLAQKNIQIEENSNTRMEDSHAALVIEHFAPGSLNVIEESSAEELQGVEAQESEIEPTNVEAPASEVIVEAQRDEVIRVPKIELSGLKVLGKIELPEVKKNIPAGETPEVEEVTSAPQKESPPRPEKPRKEKPNRQNRKDTWKNPMELQRQREAREAEEKKRDALKLEKENRKRHYEEKVKSNTKPKRVKPVAQPPIVNPTPPQKKSGGWLSRLFGW